VNWLNSLSGYSVIENIVISISVHVSLINQSQINYSTTSRF